MGDEQNTGTLRKRNKASTPKPPPQNAQKKVKDSDEKISIKANNRGSSTKRRYKSKH